MVGTVGLAYFSFKDKAATINWNLGNLSGPVLTMYCAIHFFPPQLQLLLILNRVLESLSDGIFQLLPVLVIAAWKTTTTDITIRITRFSFHTFYKIVLLIRPVAY